MLFDSILSRLVKTGALTVTDWNGRTMTYGDGTGPKIHMKLASAAAARRIALDPDLRLGEAYMSGDLSLVNGSLHDFLELLLINTGAGEAAANSASPIHAFIYKLRSSMRRITQHNPQGKAQRNVAHHYDLSGKLYDLFLDKDKQYTCAYWESDNVSLEQAQLAKKRHVAAKLDIKPGMTVLDIGCGWGGLALYLAEVCGAKVTGVTLSKEQYDVAVQRCKERGMEGQVQFVLKDYRDIDQTFDRIVSVGMFEAVGIGHFAEFFKKVSQLLKPDGSMLLHSINRSDGPGATSAWINRYIFPGGYIPALSEVMPHLERHGLYVTDIEILRMHYAKTIRHWLKRFMDNRDKAKALYDERFCRMWEYYLVGSVLSFTRLGMNNFQIQFSKDQHALPLMRDYMIAEEARLRTIEAKSKNYNVAAVELAPATKPQAVQMGAAKAKRSKPAKARTKRG